MNYIKLSFNIADQDQRETLMAMLSALDFTGFEEIDDILIAYMEEQIYEERAVQNIAEQMYVAFTKELIEKRNWNREWEQNFESVIIDGFCSVRAAFHPKPEDVEYDIVITPKMSFGTGHHATTALMIEFMRDTDFKDKKVLDFGTGTGILAILAALLGADAVLAIDNDDWSVENARENCERNKTEKVTVQLATADDLEPELQFDMILANINRHILLAYMVKMASFLKKEGILLLSGILPEDVAMVRAAAETASFRYIKEKIKMNWVCMQFAKG